MTKLYITRLLDPNKVIMGIKGVRSAGGLFSLQKVMGLREAKSLMDKLRETGEPQLIGESDDPVKLAEAENILVEHGLLTQTTEPDFAPEPHEDSPEGVFKRDARYSYEACKLAILCMTYGRGNPSAALMFARSTAYAATTPEIQARFNEASDVLKDCFVDGDDDPTVPVVMG